MSICDRHEEHYEQLAASLSGFDDGNELMDYVLEQTARELGAHSDSIDTDLNEDAVEKRLQDLGYME